MQIAENGATLGDFIGLFAKLGPMPMEKPGTKKRGRKKKPGRKPTKK